MTETILDERAVSEIEDASEKLRSTEEVYSADRSEWYGRYLARLHFDDVVTFAAVSALCATVKHLRAKHEQLALASGEWASLLDRIRAWSKCSDSYPLDEHINNITVERERLTTGLVNLYHVITGQQCERKVALGMATSAVSSLQSQLERLRAERASIEEREAAVCPEDVGFDEYIRSLQSRLAQVEQERDDARANFTEQTKTLAHEQQFRSRAIQLYKDKAAEWKAQISKELAGLTAGKYVGKAEAANELATELEKL